MNLQQMIDAINRRVDDVVDATDAVEWLNSGKDQMAIAVEATFPDLDIANMQGTFPFPSKYHEGPVLYAAARFKEYDSSISEAANFMAQFETVKQNFVRNYSVPPSYRDDRLAQQFIVSSGQTEFAITKQGYEPRYGDLVVYVNDLRVDRELVEDSTAFTPLASLAPGDRVTAVWEEHNDLIDPPYNWWSW